MINLAAMVQKENKLMEGDKRKGLKHIYNAAIF